LSIRFELPPRFIDTSKFLCDRDASDGIDDEMESGSYLSTFLDDGNFYSYDT